MQYYPQLDPECWVDEHGDYLFRYTVLRLQDSHLAEDIVQDTFLAALQNHEKFAGRSSERTWLVSILKHKISDHFRRSSHEQPEERYFTAQGNWRIAPADWSGDPSVVLEYQEVWQVLRHCLSELSPRLAHAFVLREIDGLSSEEICQVLNISPANLWVILHRARLHLRKCLEHYWCDRP